LYLSFINLILAVVFTYSAFIHLKTQDINIPEEIII